MARLGSCLTSFSLGLLLQKWRWCGLRKALPCRWRVRWRLGAALREARFAKQLVCHIDLLHARAGFFRSPTDQYIFLECSHNAAACPGGRFCGGFGASCVLTCGPALVIKAHHIPTNNARQDMRDSFAVNVHPDTIGCEAIVGVALNRYQFGVWDAYMLLTLKAGHLFNNYGADCGVPALPWHCVLQPA